jgi:hypothetical protein
MILELQIYKTCPRCSNTYPATTEYFHRAGKSGLSSYCKECKREQIRLWRAKRTNNRPRAVNNEPRAVDPITTKQIKSIKQKFPVGKWIEIIDIENRHKTRGKVTKHFKHFMTVQTAKYPTSVLYIDILMGGVGIRGLCLGGISHD